jgi:hypothetical protein
MPFKTIERWFQCSPSKKKGEERALKTYLLLRKIAIKHFLEYLELGLNFNPQQVATSPAQLPFFYVLSG